MKTILFIQDNVSSPPFPLFEMGEMAVDQRGLGSGRSTQKNWRRRLPKSLRQFNYQSPLTNYSYLNASTGSKFAARFAG